MSTIRKIANTEPVIDLHHQPGTCDSDRNSYESGQDILEQQATGALLLFTCGPQLSPNERFYCTDSGYRELSYCNTDSRKLVRSPQKIRQASEKLPVKQAAEVAAAARFISNVDTRQLSRTINGPYTLPRPRLGSITSVRDSILETTLNVPKSRSMRVAMLATSKRSKGARPPPLQLTQTSIMNDDIQTPLPTRSSSKGAPSFDVARPSEIEQLARNTPSPVKCSETKIPLRVLTPESANTFQFDFSVPSEPRLSRSGSGATDDSQSPPTPLSGPSEDQIRREIEAFALEQGPHLRGSQPRTRRPPAVLVEDRREGSGNAMPHVPAGDQLQALSLSVEPERGSSTSSAIGTDAHPALRRKKSIFGWLQKKPEVEVDDLIDLYLTDEQKDDMATDNVKSVRRMASKPKMALFRNRVTTDPLPRQAG